MAVQIVCADGRLGTRGAAVPHCLWQWHPSFHTSGLVLSPENPNYFGVEWKQIPEMDWKGYSAFCLRELINFVHPEASHVLVVQDDGYILRPDLWDDAWLSFDFCGAPWSDGVVGNGGFSLRSRKLLDYTTTLPWCGDMNEDEVICRMYPGPLNIAPKEVAEYFSYETVLVDHPTFGFHTVKHD